MDRAINYLLLLTTATGMAVVITALLVTAFIFWRSRQDVLQIKEIEASLTRMKQKEEESDYISDEIANVLYDLYELIGQLKAYVELSDEGCKVNESLFQAMNNRGAMAEKHFLELGLFSQDTERRKSVGMALASRFGDQDTAKIMKKIVDGTIGIRDKDIVILLGQLERRLKGNQIYIESSSWTGRPRGGSF
jgi:hypothetical protein